VEYLSHWQTNFPVISRKGEQEVEKFDVTLKVVKHGIELTDDDDVDFKGDDHESEYDNTSDHGNSRTGRCSSESSSGSSSSSSSSSSDDD